MRCAGKKFYHSYMNGFTLIEIMLVVGVFALLTGLAIFPAKRMVIRARQVEARMNLKHLFVLEQAYQTQNGAYWPFSGDNLGSNSANLTSQTIFFTTSDGCTNNNDLGFYIASCMSARYAYAAGGDQTQFIVSAAEIKDGAGIRKVVPGCQKPIEFIMPPACAPDGIGKADCKFANISRTEHLDYWNLTQDNELTHGWDPTKSCVSY